jgi:hypothetical protein
MSQIAHARTERLRTIKQNAFYFAGPVTSFMLYLARRGHPKSKNMIHHMFKTRFLPLVALDPHTGELVREIKESTSDLTVSEFNMYVEMICAYLAQTYEITV